MAAFSYQGLPNIVDCMLSPEMMIKLSSSSSSSTTTTNNNSPLLSPSCCFSEDQSHLLNSNSTYHEEPIFDQLQFQYPFGNLVNFQQNELNSVDFNLHDNSCVDVVTPMGSTENEPCLTVKQSNLGTQNWTAVNNKRKPSEIGSKDERGGRSKKQRKCKNEVMKEENKEEDDKEKNKMKELNKSKKPAKEAPKGYIHVRARRGQATDSHSLAERVRREKISERMKFLQALVPGCDKVTGKATMLDEIINYVQSLQSQVEFLSMKLSSLSPMVYNFGVDLDTLLLEQQGLNNVAPECSPSTTMANTQTPSYAPASSTAYECPLVGAPVMFPQQVERGANPQCVEDHNVIGSLYWGVGDQGGPDPINQPGFRNNNNYLMYSF